MAAMRASFPERKSFPAFVASVCYLKWVEMNCQQQFTISFPADPIPVAQECPAVPVFVFFGHRCWLRRGKVRSLLAW